MVERAPVRSCVRRGAAIDLVLARPRENRSQIVFTKARGRDMVFWQSARTRKQARPKVSLPTARAAGIPPSASSSTRMSGMRTGSRTSRSRTRVAPLACGDYGLEIGGALIASVERKSLTDFVSSVTDGRLRFALGELAALPRAAVVVEERYSQLFKVDWVRPAVVLDGLAELQVRYPNVPIVFCETRSLAEEWTYRYLAAARVWAETESAAVDLIEGATHDTPSLERTTSASAKGGWKRFTSLRGRSEGVGARGGYASVRPRSSPAGDLDRVAAGASGSAVTVVARRKDSRGGVSGVLVGGYVSCSRWCCRSPRRRSTSRPDASSSRRSCTSARRPPCPGTSPAARPTSGSP